MSLATSVRDHLEEIFGPFSDLKTDTINPERSWPMHITSMDEPVPGELTITLGVHAGAMAQLGKENCRAVLALTGECHPELQRVVMLDGAGRKVGEAHRRDIPMLNQKFGRR